MTPPALPSTATLRTYWEDRAVRFAGRTAGLPAVCSYGMPWYYNRAIHLGQWLALRPWLRVAPGTRVLDVGCGVGRWSVALAQAGAAVTGVDWSERMLDEARRRAERDGVAAQCAFVAGDAGTLDVDGRFDLILCVTVLQHILDPGRFEAAWGRLVSHLAPGGRIVLLEVAPDADNPRCDTAVFHARTVDTYRALAARWDLDVDAVTGVDPAPFKLWLLPHYKGLPAWVGQPLLMAATLASLPVDGLMGRRLARASWHKVIVLSHPDRAGASPEASPLGEALP